jgi:hypothetical protein
MGSVPIQEGFDFQPRGLRLKAISTFACLAWHFEQRSRVQACLRVTFQPSLLASMRGSISRSCPHRVQPTQMTYDPEWSESLSMELAGRGGMGDIFSLVGCAVQPVPVIGGHCMNTLSIRTKSAFDGLRLRWWGNLGSGMGAALETEPFRQACADDAFPQQRMKRCS